MNDTSKQASMASRYLKSMDSSRNLTGRKIKVRDTDDIDSLSSTASLPNIVTIDNNSFVGRDLDISPSKTTTSTSAESNSLAS